MKPLAQRTEGLIQSNIRAVTLMLKESGGINLGQGICDMPTPSPIKEAAKRAIDDDESIYSYYGGIDSLRASLVEKASTYNKIPVSTPEEVMVTVGSTGAFVATMFCLLNPGDEVIVFEPFYGYHVNLLQVMGAQVRYIPTAPPDWDIPFDVIEESITKRSKAIVLNSPGNPHGKVWTHDELTRLNKILEQHDLFAITDEIYEYMLYDERVHCSLAALPGAFDRTITISGFSKTYNMTGWRIGYAIGPEPIISKMGLLADLLYICSPTPLQHGVAAAFEMDDHYFDDLATAYDQKRTLMCSALEEVGFNVSWPQGSYYVLADFSPLRDRIEGFEDDVAACKTLIHRAKVGTVPGHSFFNNPADGRMYVRFCFAKELDVLQSACDQLREALSNA
ncbi:MAG: pyridoxal phosphate-dependent aminotransferase [Rhodothermia bacterium]|nr:MAG: pyridoxal phosphate-dependent aminotransferase [Rhodothermia bacterium]